LQQISARRLERGDIEMNSALRVAPESSGLTGRIARFAMHVALGVLLVSGLTACANQVPTPGSGLGQNGADGGPVVPGTPRDFTVNVGNTVYFTTDQVEVAADSAQTLKGQAGWLNQYSQYTILIEGHADERGTREYNLALGAQRAANVKAYLISQGVQAARLRTITYGKERPVATCNDISCWSQNRRAVTVLNQKAGS
jgi:peptidoglycan-associated lipoprotein